VIGYQHFAECNAKNVSWWYNFVIKFIFISFQVSLMMFGTTGAFLTYVVYSYLPCYCFLNYMRVLQKHLELKCKLVAATKLGNIYRQIQLLVAAHNNIHQKVLTVCTTGLYQTCFILPAFVIIRHGDQLLFPLIVCFGVIIVYALMAIFEIVGAVIVNVFSVSKAVVQSFKSIPVTTKGNDKWIRKFGKSLPIVKMGLGSGNFFDECTPLVMVDFAITQTVSLLLI